MGDRLYTLLRDGDDEVVVCWNADTGKDVWRYPYPGKYSRSRFVDQQYSAGPRSTPTVDGDLVFAAGATGILTCVKASSGKKVWQKDLFEEFNARKYQWGASYSPLVVGELVYACPGGPDGNSLAAFHKKTGELAWKKLDDIAGYSSPVVMTVDGTLQVVFFTGEGLVGVAPDTGKLLWRFPWETQYNANIATPAVVGPYVFLSSGYGRGCAVVEVSQGKGGEFQARRVYEGNQMCNHYASSVRYKDYIYGFNDTLLTCMSFRTGEVLWKERGFQKGSLILADGNLIVLGEKGKLAVAPASPKEFKPVSSSKVPGRRSRFWNIPVLAGGRLYVRDEDHLICLDVRKLSEK
jgi:outer membrane protein assembly factor BamB